MEIYFIIKYIFGYSQIMFQKVGNDLDSYWQYI